MKKAVIQLFTVFSVLCFTCSGAFAAVGCTLNDPERDIRRLFQESTGYRTDFITIEERGGEKLLKDIEEKLGDKLDTVYESIDVPYAYYTVLRGKEIIGRVHGVNQKGTYGGMQIILATDPEGRIIGLYYQKISSPEAAKFRSESFTDQFKGLTLEDFYKQESSSVSAIKDPTEKNSEDFRATLRGIKKNLILLNTFWFESEENKKEGVE